MGQWEGWSFCCSNHEAEQNVRYRKRRSNCRDMDPSLLTEEEECSWRPYNFEYDSKYLHDCATFRTGRRMNSQINVEMLDPNVVKLKQASGPGNFRYNDNHWQGASLGFNFRVADDNDEAADDHTVEP